MSLPSTLNSVSNNKMRPCFDFGQLAIRNKFRIIDCPQQKIKSSVSEADLARFSGWFSCEEQSSQQKSPSTLQQSQGETSVNTSNGISENRDYLGQISKITNAKEVAVDKAVESNVKLQPKSEPIPINNTESFRVEQLKDKMRNWQQNNLKRAKSWDIQDNAEDKSPVMRKKSDPMFCSASSATVTNRERRSSSWTESSFQEIKKESMPQIDIQSGLWGANRNMRSVQRGSFDESEEGETVSAYPQCDSTTRPGLPLPKRGSGQVHLYAFLLYLLDDDADDKKDICWLNRSKREFKIINPGAVATRWGFVKHKPNMTYEKMSRALRYYYRKNIIEKVREHQYVYRFTDKVEMKSTEK